jgi:hypothetical protein
MRRLFRVGLCVGVLCCLSLVGCGDKGPFTAEISGKVTVDGQPIDGGAIQFVPLSGDAPTSGSRISGGRYQVSAPPVEMKVSISAPKIVGKKKIYDTPDSPEMPITEEALPKKFNDATELRFSPKAGTNEKDWDLKTK